MSILTENWHIWHILEVLILNPDLDFWNCDPKIHFWANLGPKIQSFSENWYAQHLKMLIPNPDVDFVKFWPQNPFLGKFGPKKSRMSVLFENWDIWYLKHADSYPNISFLNFKSEFPFGKFGPKKSKLSVLTENWYTWYLGSADSESGLRFLKFRP